MKEQVTSSKRILAPKRIEILFSVSKALHYNLKLPRRFQKTAVPCTRTDPIERCRAPAFPRSNFLHLPLRRKQLGSFSLLAQHWASNRLSNVQQPWPGAL